MSEPMTPEKIVELIRHGETFPCRGIDGDFTYGLRFVPNSEAKKLITDLIASTLQSAADRYCLAFCALEKCDNKIKAKCRYRKAILAPLNKE